MPIYQYRCTDCGHQMEALQKMSDPKLTDCPKCHAPALQKQVTAAAFKLKGTGWYETDFKNSGSKPAANSDAKSTDAKSTDAKSTDAKSADSGASTSAAASD